MKYKGKKTSILDTFHNSASASQPPSSRGSLMAEVCSALVWNYLKSPNDSITLSTCSDTNWSAFIKRVIGVTIPPTLTCALMPAYSTSPPFICRPIVLWRTLNFSCSGKLLRKGCFIGNAQNLYSRGAPFESPPGLRVFRYIYIVTCLLGNATRINVDSPDLTRKFIGTIVEITHNRYNTQFRVW
jgi:hypothetical protein